MPEQTARVLVVAHRAAATTALCEAVRERAEASPARFTLLVPARPHGIQRMADPEDADTAEVKAVLAAALPRLRDAAGGEVDGMVGTFEPLAAIEDALNAEDFDEVIISTLPTRVSRWLRLDLPSKVRGLGKPVTVVTAKERAKAGAV